jgi:hypothetical protein
MTATAVQSDKINPEYLLKRLDDPTFLSYLAALIAQSSVVVGKIDRNGDDYSDLAVGTYAVVDQFGVAISLPNASFIKSVFFVVDTAFTSGGSATLEVGYSGTTNALVPQTAVASLTADTGIAGTPVGVLAGSILRKAETPITVTIGTAAMTAGVGYVVIEYFKLPEFT